MLGTVSKPVTRLLALDLKDGEPLLLCGGGHLSIAFFISFADSTAYFKNFAAFCISYMFSFLCNSSRDYSCCDKHNGGLSLLRKIYFVLQTFSYRYHNFPSHVTFRTGDISVH